VWVVLFIGSLKAGFVTERSEPGSCRAFSVQYPILALVASVWVVLFIGIRTLCGLRAVHGGVPLSGVSSVCDAGESIRVEG